MTLFAFLWPAPLAIGAARARKHRVRVLCAVGEPVLAVGSLWLVFVAP